jgi:hypothetical protein
MAHRVLLVWQEVVDIYDRPAGHQPDDRHSTARVLDMTGLSIVALWRKNGGRKRGNISRNLRVWHCYVVEVLGSIQKQSKVNRRGIRQTLFGSPFNKPFEFDTSCVATIKCVVRAEKYGFNLNSIFVQECRLVVHGFLGRKMRAMIATDEYFLKFPQEPPVVLIGFVQQVLEHVGYIMGITRLGLPVGAYIGNLEFFDHTTFFLPPKYNKL